MHMRHHDHMDRSYWTFAVQLLQVKSLEATIRRLRSDVEAAAGEKGTLLAQEQAARSIAKESVAALFEGLRALSDAVIRGANSVGEVGSAECWVALHWGLRQRRVRLEGGGWGWGGRGWGVGGGG